MPQTLHAFMNSIPVGTANIAGHLYGPTLGGRDNPHRAFRYWRSTNPMLPAFINALEGSGKGKKLYTNYLANPWVSPRGPGAKRLSVLKVDSGDGAKMIEPVLQVGPSSWPKQLIGTAGAAPFDGGLHAAATAISGGNNAMVAGTKDKGLKQALRYYMLAAYSLLDISVDSGFDGLNNYVAALLVSDKGEILSAGINTGDYRHAEVSMLVSYFRKNPGAARLPAKSVVFSTLTPCKQCTGYLSAAKAPDTVIYFGQSDTGTSGRAGEAIADKLSEKTLEPPVGRSKTELTGTVPPEVVEDAGGEGVAAPAAASTIHRVALSAGLTACMGKGVIASQIGKAEDSRDILGSASNALIHKVMKDRTGGEEDTIKDAALHHITYWLGTTRVTTT